MTDDERAGFYAGDERVFAALVVAYTPRMLALARRFAPNDAEDAVQESWLRAFRARGDFRGGSVLAWLLAICRSACLDQHRMAATRPLARAAPLDTFADDVPGMPHVDPPCSGDDASDLERHLMRAVLDLPAQQRDVVLLRVVEGRSTRETAAALGRAEGTVKAALHHALRTLRTRLAAAKSTTLGQERGRDGESDERRPPR